MTGLVPFGSQAAITSEAVSADAAWATSPAALTPPRAITALLQPGYWTGLQPPAVFGYAHFVAVVWLVIVGALTACGAVFGSPWLARAGVKPFGSAIAGTSGRRNTNAPLAGDPRHSPLQLLARRAVTSAWNTLAWTCGRAVATHVALYYLLAVTTVYQLWAFGFHGGQPVIGAWIVGLVVLVALPAAVAAWTTARGASEPSPSTGGSVVFGPLLAGFTPTARWFGCLALAHRLLFAVVVVVAANRPAVQVVLLVALSLLWFAAVVSVQPYRHSGVQRFTVATAAFRVVVLLFTVAFIPTGVADYGEVSRIAGGGLCLALVFFPLELWTMGVFAVCRQQS